MTKRKAWFQSLGLCWNYSLSVCVKKKVECSLMVMPIIHFVLAPAAHATVRAMRKLQNLLLAEQ